MKTFLTGLFGLLGIPLTVVAQSDSVFVPSMQEVHKQNYWLSGSNPVGLSFNRFDSFSVAEVNYGYTDGNLGKVSLPNSMHIYSVLGESYQKLGSVALYGKLHYMQGQSRGQNWNGMTNDYWQAVNLCDSVSGSRRKETYHLHGAVSVPVGSHWLVGSQLNYRVEMTTKDTDPRNKNQWSEWILAPGLGYRADNFILGISLLYANRKESVDYQNMGTHATYPYFTAYPLSFFQTLPKDESVKWNYTGQEFGGAMQLDYDFGLFRWFQQVEGSITKQKIESNRIKDRREGETDFWQITYSGKLQKLSGRNWHEWGLKMGYGKADNYDPWQQQEEAGVWESYGKVLRSTRRMEMGELNYEYRQMRDAWNPRFSIYSGVRYCYHESTLLFFPMKYAQPLHRFALHAAFTRHFLLPDASLDCSVGGEYGKGGGTIMKEEKLTSDQSAGEMKLWQNAARLQQDYDYATAARFALNISVTYTHKVPFCWFIRLSGGYEYSRKCLPSENGKKINAHIGLMF